MALSKEELEVLDDDPAHFVITACEFSIALGAAPSSVSVKQLSAWWFDNQCVALSPDHERAGKRWDLTVNIAGLPPEKKPALVDWLASRTLSLDDVTLTVIGGDERRDALTRLRE